MNILGFSPLKFSLYGKLSRKETTMKSFISVAVLSVALFAAPATQAASYQDRTMATGAVVGAATGAAVGAGSNQVVEGAIFGAVLGTVAGAIIGSQHRETVYVSNHRDRSRHGHARSYERRHDHKPVYTSGRHHRPQYGNAHGYERRHTYSNARRYDRSRSYGRHERRDRD